MTALNAPRSRSSIDRRVVLALAFTVDERYRKEILKVALLPSAAVETLPPVLREMLEEERPKTRARSELAYRKAYGKLGEAEHITRVHGTVTPPPPDPGTEEGPPARHLRPHRRARPGHRPHRVPIAFPLAPRRYPHRRFESHTTGSLARLPRPGETSLQGRMRRCSNIVSPSPQKFR